MTKRYQVMNWQNQPVKTCLTQYEAEQHIHALREVYTSEGFYVIELNVVFSIGISNDV